MMQYRIIVKRRHVSSVFMGLLGLFVIDDFLLYAGRWSHEEIGS